MSWFSSIFCSNDEDEDFRCSEDEPEMCVACGFYHNVDSMRDGDLCKHCYVEQLEDDELRRLEGELVDSMYGADIDPGDEYYEE